MEAVEETPRKAISDVITEEEAAGYVNMSRIYLRLSRMQKPVNDGPPWLKIGRSVRYRVSDLDAWLDSKKRNSAKASRS